MQRIRLSVLTALLAGFFGQAAWAAEDYDVVRGAIYAERGKEKLRADVYVPPGEGPHPAVLVVHGGAWMMGTRHQLRFACQSLVRSGYTAVAINYRLAPLHKFPAQLEDCQTAVRWMRTHADQFKIDPLRIGGYGYSAGGHLVTLLGVLGEVADMEPQDVSARLQAVVAGGAPCDFRQLPEDNRRLAYWLGGSRADKPELYRQASPAAFASDDDPPCFFFHGEDDSVVPLLSPQWMKSKLEEVGVRSELYVVPDAGHQAALGSAEAVKRTGEFFDRHLKK